MALEGSGDGNLVSRRIHKVLNMRLENDKDTLDALKELSYCFPENSAVNRRNLKSNVEKRALELNEEFLSSLRNVHLALDKIYIDVSNMNQSVNEMMGRLSATKAKTRTLIDKTTSLQKEIVGVETKQLVSDSIIDRFKLDPAEVAALRGTNVSCEMFAALKRAEEIHANCRSLVQAGFEILARDIMDQMSLYEEGGIERIFRWTQARCRTIDQPDPNALLPQAIAKLHSRTTLFEQVMEEYCANRRDLLVRQLISALTRGGRPIEHRVTEPKRYVGDMLAWLHQAVPAERDNLSYLLKHCDSIDVAERIQHALCSITEGVCHPLKVRVEHILLGENNVRDPLLLQTLLGLLRYYHDIIHQIVGQGSLQNTLVELMDTAEKTMFMSLTARVAVLLGSQIEAAPDDLNISPGVSRVLALLNQILGGDISTSSLAAQKTVTCVVDPLLIHVTETATRLPSIEAAVYLLNAYHSVETVLALHAFLDDRLERLKAQSEAQVDTLTSEQASSLVAHLGIGAIYTALQGAPQKPLSRLPAFDSGQISAVTAKLNKIVTNPDLFLLPQLTLLSSVSRRIQIQRRAGTVIHSIYLQLYNAVNDPDNQFIDPENLLSLTPDVVLDAFSK